MEVQHGLDAAKILMHHGASSDTYRRWYDKGIQKFHVFAIATGEKELELETPQGSAINRIVVRTIDREAFLLSYVDNDVDVTEARKRLEATPSPSDEMRTQLRTAQRRAYYHGRRAIDNAEKEMNSSHMTPEELHRRIAELKEPTSLAKYIQELAERRVHDKDAKDISEIRIVDPEEPLTWRIQLPSQIQSRICSHLSRLCIS